MAMMMECSVMGSSLFQSPSSDTKFSWKKEFSSHGNLSTETSLARGSAIKPSCLVTKRSPKSSLSHIRNALLRGATKINGDNGVFSNTSVSEKTESLDSYEDDYDGEIIDPDRLPSNAATFASSLRASLSDWKLKGKKGIWLKIYQDKCDLVPVAIKEGFTYHHAEPGYVMLTYWIPKEPCLLPSSASHLVGVGSFVINDKKEVLVVQEKKCALRCSGVWKFPTGFVDKSEEIFAGAIREVKEETGIDAEFVEVIAFRHAHFMDFEKSDLFFICMLKPLSTVITTDESEIQAAKWMPLEEFKGQPFYQEDCLSKKVLDLCIASFKNSYRGLTARQLRSKLDGKLSYLYYCSC
ncbi:hypothetical protein AMTRI_Chr05g67760 [Amborella trichopoda]